MTQRSMVYLNGMNAIFEKLKKNQEWTYGAEFFLRQDTTLI